MRRAPSRTVPCLKEKDACIRCYSENIQVFFSGALDLVSSSCFLEIENIAASLRE